MKSLVAAAVMLFALPASAQVSVNVSVTKGLSIVVSAPFDFTLNPPSPLHINCATPPGTVLTTIVPQGGDGDPLQVTIAGDTEGFVASNSSIVVAPGGLAPACGKTSVVNVTATQP